MQRDLIHYTKNTPKLQDKEQNGGHYDYGKTTERAVAFDDDVGFLCFAGHECLHTNT